MALWNFTAYRVVRDMIEDFAFATGLPAGTTIARRICKEAHSETMAWHAWARVAAAVAMTGKGTKPQAFRAYISPEVLAANPNHGAAIGAWLQSFPIARND